MAENKTTPLYEQHKKSGAKLAEFGGFLMPIQYQSAIEEHLWCRKKTAVFDTSHMGQLLVEGNTAQSELDKIVTVDTTKIPSFKCRYGFMLNEEGGIKDDLIVYKISSEKFVVIVNSGTAWADKEHVEKNLDKARLSFLSDNYGKIDVQGPVSADVLKDIFSIDLSGLKYYGFGYFDILGESCIVSRTGYTGERGYELCLPNSVIVEVWSKLLDDERVKPAGLAARDTLRLEAGLPLYSQDITEATTPLEAGLGRFISFDTNFIGKERLEELKNKISRKFVFFKSDSRQSPRHDYKIYIDGESVGFVTSGTFSPCLQRGIGAGYVDRPQVSAGQQIVVKSNGREIKCTIINKPFVETKK